MRAVAKAVAAFVLAFLSAFAATVQGRTDLDTMSGADWLVVIVAALVTAAGVWAVPNAPAASPGDRTPPP
jgi:hypothetical protein